MALIFSSSTFCYAEGISGLRIVPVESDSVSYGVISASRTSGVAPLSVVFSTNFSNDSNNGQGFHYYDYSWDFDDSSSGDWGTTGKSKNTATGAVAAHIFETAGTYNVKVTIRSKNKDVASKSFTISVTDPDNYYSGTNTTCVNPAGDTNFSGAPTGSRKVSTDDLSTITQYATIGNRILFKRGASWSTTELSWPTNSGPVTIGAYGTGTNADDSGRYENAPEISVTSGTFLSLNKKQDWRIMDLSLVDPTQANGAFGGTTEMKQILMLRLSLEGFTVPVGWSHWNDPDGMQIDQMAVVSCEASNSSTNIAYVGSERLALLGNTFKNPDDSHVVRIWQAYKSVIGHNIISGSSLNSTTGRQAMKFHGASETQVSSTTWDHLENRSEYTIVSDNIFGSSGPWPVSMGPQDNGADERLSNIIFERNFYCADYGDRSSGSNTLSVAVRIVGRQVTVRNNIIDGSNYGNSFTGIWVCSDSVAPVPQDIWIYNNTIYKSDNISGNERIGIELDTDVSDVIIKNNIVCFPDSNLATTLVNDQGSGNNQTSNILNGTISFDDPDNASPLLRSFALKSSATSVIDKGSTIYSVFEDFDGNPRPDGAAYDIGAYEY